MTRRHFLFVCTGNTCRSPMAQAIAENLFAQIAPTGVMFSAASAGVYAENGYSATNEAVQALAQRGIDLASHRSQALTTELIEQADVIYTMTPRHAQAVLAMVPQAKDKVFPLDESQPIADPIGGPIEVYCDVAAALERLIKAKIEEIPA